MTGSHLPKMPADSGGAAHEDPGRARRPGAEKTVQKLLEVPDGTAHNAGLLAFLQRELSWGSSLGWSQPTSGGKPVEDLFLFFRLPWFLERFLIFGYLLCFDMFLFNLTYLPLRCIAAVYHGGVALLRRMLCGCSRHGGGGGGGGGGGVPDGTAGSAASAHGGASGSGSASAPSASPRDARLGGRSRRAGGGGFTRASSFDLLKGAILVAATLMLGFLQVRKPLCTFASWYWHWHWVPALWYQACPMRGWVDALAHRARASHLPLPRLASPCLSMVARCMRRRRRLQISRVYHYIRGEAVIKLYVIFNILEIVDKLCASLGADMMVRACVRACEPCHTKHAACGMRV